MKKPAREEKIIIVDEKHGLPYSKGLMATSMTATGLPPSQAYWVATRVEEELRESGKTSVTTEEVRDTAYHVLLEEVGEKYAERYVKWLALQTLDKPIIILFGGTTGVGKSTVATEVAHRLGITRIVSTDSIREVLRTVFSPELVPALHASSFEAGKTLRLPVPEEADPLIIGFREQTAVVTLGIKAAIKRAVQESRSLVMEGIHIVPGFIDFVKDWQERAFIIPVILSVKDEGFHRSRFYVREIETDGDRSYERYRANFENIRQLGYYIEGLARQHGVTVVECEELDKTVAGVLESIFYFVFASPEIIEKVKEVPIKE